MAGTGRSRWRLALGAAILAAVAGGSLAASADAMSVIAHTNRGGVCRLATHASRAGTQIRYGIKVNDCSTRFGVRYAISSGILYDESAGVPFKRGYLARRKGEVPYLNQRAVSGTDPTHDYRTRLDVSVVLKTRRNRATPHPERWRDPGAHCRVKTTYHDGDTLGCELGDRLPAP